MPIHVEEVVISVEVTNEAAGGAQSTPPLVELRQSIIAECIERMLERLKRRGEPGASAACWRRC
jgi:hypothetical protein